MYTLLIQVLDTKFIIPSSDNLITTVLRASFSTLKLICVYLKINNETYGVCLYSTYSNCFIETDSVHNIKLYQILN